MEKTKKDSDSNKEEGTQEKKDKIVLSAVDFSSCNYERNFGRTQCGCAT